MSTKQQVYSLEKTRTSLVGAAVLSGLFILGMMAGGFGGGFIEVVLMLLAVIGSPIGAYRGAIATNSGKAATALCTLIAFYPPIGLAIHLIFLGKLRSAKKAPSDSSRAPRVQAPIVPQVTPPPRPVAPPVPEVNRSAGAGFADFAPMPSSTASFRQQVADADTNRRKVLLSLIQQYPEDITPLVEALISSASPETLTQVEAMLAKGAVK